GTRRLAERRQRGVRDVARSPIPAPGLRTPAGADTLRRGRSAPGPPRRRRARKGIAMSNVIMVPLDGSEFAERALDVAGWLAARIGRAACRGSGYGWAGSGGLR